MNTVESGTLSDREKIIYIVGMLNYISLEDDTSIKISPEYCDFLYKNLNPVKFLSHEVETMIRAYPEIFEMYGFRKTPGYFGERFKYNNKRVLFS